MEQRKSFLEVVNTEKQMSAAIHSKDITPSETLELYRKIRTGYEKILLSSNQMLECHEVEYNLWKLHYKLIDEFRRRLKQRSSDAESMKNDTLSDNVNSRSDAAKGLEGFKSFLSEAAEFYKRLVVKLRKNCGLPEEIFLKNKDVSSFSVESTKLHACKYTCHRLLICLGDLARYTELVKKPDACEWSTAATYYLEATRTWPDSGNPHNQLALLATYVGDAFLALYHCVRSLAVKEPFPDAWRNVMLLFEENRSAKLQTLSTQMHLDFLIPSKRSSLPNRSNEEISSPHDAKSELWPILVRTMSFFLIRSSLDEFPCTLASAVHCLEALLAVDDAKLTAALQSYEQMDTSRRGPYRAVQLVSIFIFIVHSLTESREREQSTGKDNQKRSVFTALAFTAILICMGRLTERCQKVNHTHSCPLLPAVLVFLEWLVGKIDAIEAYNADEKVINALSYFFGALADLLDRVDKHGNKIAPDYTALWEDHELRGFYPLANVHERLDFATNLECMVNFECKNDRRLQRVFHAAARIMNGSKCSRECVSNDKVRSLFNSLDEAKAVDQGEAETAASVTSLEVKKPDEKTDTFLRNEVKAFPKATMEEEEVILFKPITRRNSAPLYISKATNDPIGPEDTNTQKTSSDEYLRRAASLSTGQNTTDSDSFSFSTTSNSGHSRPPSLSAWVFSGGISKTEQEKGQNDFNKHKLSPIEEVPSTSFSDLSINETKQPEVSVGHFSTISHSPSPCVTTPIPSAPLLPDDAVWLSGNSSFFPEHKNSMGSEADGILGAAPVSSYMTRLPVRPPVGFGPRVSGLVEGYPPFLGMSSSEWLYHYRNSQNIPPSHISPLHFNPPAFGNFRPSERSSFDLCDQWGNQLVSNPMHYFGSTPQMYPDPSLVYGAEEQKQDQFFLGYQRPFPYVCGVGMELSNEQPQLLQYLKEKERQLQPGSQLRGPTFMGN